MPTNKASDRKLPALTLVKSPPRPRPKLSTIYYPPALKQYTMDLLKLYKIKLSEKTGKPVGWQTIRDQIMEPEDRILRREEEKLGIKQTRNKARSKLLDKEDFKGWFDKGKTHLPMDHKFQYIDRFIRSLRKDGALDAYELELAASERDYIREALYQFYKPHHAGSALILDGSAELVDTGSKKAFIGLSKLRENADKPPHNTQILYLLLFKGDGQAIVAVDIIACLPSPRFLVDRLRQVESVVNPDPLIHKKFIEALPPIDPASCKHILVYSGFLIPDRCLQNGIAKMMLQARNQSNALSEHVGFDVYTDRYYSHNVSITGFPGHLVLRAPQKTKDYFWRGDAGFEGNFYEIPDNTPGLTQLYTAFAAGYRPC